MKRPFSSLIACSGKRIKWIDGIYFALNLREQKKQKIHMLICVLHAVIDFSSIEKSGVGGER